MIHYQLRCCEAHEFDGWFRDSAAFDEQARAGLLECPMCGTSDVTRALMAPSVPRRGRVWGTAPAAAPETEPRTAAVTLPEPPPQPLAIPDELRAALQRARAEVERHCDYVGTAFADEARRMHRGVTDSRPIYGEATPDDAEALAEEGIDVCQMPWVPRADS